MALHVDRVVDSTVLCQPVFSSHRTGFSWRVGLCPWLSGARSLALGFGDRPHREGPPSTLHRLSAQVWGGEAEPLPAPPLAPGDTVRVPSSFWASVSSAVVPPVLGSPQGSLAWAPLKAEPDSKAVGAGRLSRGRFWKTGLRWQGGGTASRGCVTEVWGLGHQHRTERGLQGGTEDAPWVVPEG